MRSEETEEAKRVETSQNTTKKKSRQDPMLLPNARLPEPTATTNTESYDVNSNQYFSLFTCFLTHVRWHPIKRGKKKKG